MHRIAVIQEFEEDKFDEIPKWDGEMGRYTDSAVLLRFAKEDVWFPISVLRTSGDRLSLYAANWFLERKGL